MAEMTEKGCLPIGVDFEGETHREFEVRPRKIRDSLDVASDPLSQKSDSYFGLCVISRQITKLGTIPPEAITSGMVADMHEDDFYEIQGAVERLKKRLRSFSGERSTETEDGTGTA